MRMTQILGLNSSLGSPQRPIHQNRQKWRSEQGIYADHQIRRPNVLQPQESIWAPLGDECILPGKLLPLNSVSEQLIHQSPSDDRCQVGDWGDLPWDAHQGNTVKVSDQLLVVNEEPLTSLDQGQRDNREQDVTFANSSHHLVYQNVRAEHMQQVGTAHTCCKARNTHIAMEHQDHTIGIISR